VSVLGLGAMGSALARAFLAGGHDVTVWNRTAARADPLVRRGAKVAPSLAEAVTASPMTVVCIDDYDATMELLDRDGVLTALEGRTLVQLSTGTPAEARGLAQHLAGRGVAILDGAIMPYPEGIGAEDAQILFAGMYEAFATHKPTLDCLGGDLRHVGEDISAAAALDMALLTHQLSSYLGVWHGALACEAEGIGLDTFASLFPQSDPAANLAWRIHRAQYTEPGATLEVWNAALDRILGQAEQAGINREIPGLISSLFRRAIALGHGEHDVASVIEVLRGTAE
jgi:3-hydroxyisobutyrate dehydrogenase-like beta-hydroxyacid dehydrogenase